MIDGYPKVLTVAAAIGSAVAGGVFFAFSTFVMKALDRLPRPQGISAMQSINRAAPSPWFMTALFGTAAVCVVLVITGVRRIGEPWAPHLLTGGGLYLAAIVLTITYHVPRNDALALVDPSSAGAADIWRTYVTNWTAWNHVRTALTVAGAVAFTLGLVAD